MMDINNNEEKEAHLEPVELEHGQLVINGSILYEVAVRELEPGSKPRGGRVIDNKVVSFIAYNPARRALRQTMHDLGLKGSRVKIRIKKAIRRAEKRRLQMQRHIERLEAEKNG